MTRVATGRDFRADAALRPQPKRDGGDSWSTPECLCTALCRDILPTLPGGPVWEPACGDGALVRAMEVAGRRVVASDLVADNNFLANEPPPGHFAAIITNPPFNALDGFIRRGLALLDAGGAQALVLLLRWDHLPAQCRAPLWGRASAVHVCTWRPRWIPGSTTGPRWNFAWIVWRAGCSGPPRLLPSGRGL